jgi:hypothetical protein
MRAAGSVALFLALAVAFAVTPVAVPRADQAGAPPARAEKLPPLSYACPMHPEQFGNKGDTCPICKMDLAPVRLTAVWTCGTKPLAVIKDAPGRCAIDGSALVQVTAVMTWSCPGGADESASPGACPGGAPKELHYALRAHGNHNPQHGGLFFMAADNIHHLEGAYLPSGTFRMFFYDEFTKPQKLAAMRAYKATLNVKDPKTGKDTTYSLVRSGAYLQASIGKLPMPAEMYATVTFTADGKGHRFDFTFPAYSKEPHGAPAATPTMTNAAPPPAAPATPASLMPDASGGIDPALVPLPIPETVPEMLSQLKARTEQVGALIDKGIFAAIYVPAFQAKDLALALDQHKNALSPEHRRIAGPAISRLVRSAYLLDAFGDIGNKQQISEAYAKFVEASKDIQSAFPQ